jgi:hypothetical protein
VKLDVYEHLLRINRGFNLVIKGLAALRKHGAFQRRTGSVPRIVEGNPSGHEFLSCGGH